jgi:hypothetical protein
MRTGTSAVLPLNFVCRNAREHCDNKHVSTQNWLREAKMVVGRTLQVGLITVVLLSGMGIAPASSARATAANTTVEGQELANDTLRQMLDGMGMEPKALSKGYLVALKQDTWTINLQVVISDNKLKIGLNANLGKIEDPDSVTASQWRALLIANGDVDPSAFYFDKDQKKLYLHRSFDNRAVTPAFLRGQIENFAANVRGTEPLWKFTK